MAQLILQMIDPLLNAFLTSLFLKIRQNEVIGFVHVRHRMHNHPDGALSQLSALKYCMYYPEDGRDLFDYLFEYFSIQQTVISVYKPSKELLALMATAYGLSKVEKFNHQLSILRYEMPQMKQLSIEVIKE